MGDMRMAIQVMATPPMMKLVQKYDKENGHPFFIYPYVNGREKGFMIADTTDREGRNNGRAIAFTECRNSDSLTVYVGKSYKSLHDKDADKGTHFIYDYNTDVIKLTETIYRNHRYDVWCDELPHYKKVGNALAKFLTGKINEETLATTLAKINKDALEELHRRM
jgi:hypothetical protein